MKKFIAVAGIVAVTASAALAGTASASAPVNGSFGQERSSNIQQYFTNDGYGNWGQFVDGAAARAADNSLNPVWAQQHGELPVESNAGL